MRIIALLITASICGCFLWNQPSVCPPSKPNCAVEDPVIPIPRTALEAGVDAADAG
jgi:hypothetical protein